MSKYKADNILISFKFAIRGILVSLKSQRNFQIDVVVALIAVILSVLLDFSPIETAILTFTIGFILFAELINTALEFVIDAYFGRKYSILAKMTKDIAAGAVLISAITALTIGMILFLPKIAALF